MKTKELKFEVSERSGSVSGLLVAPPKPKLLYVLAHGAGAGMRHPFMESMAAALAERGVATFRYQFPYMEAGGRGPDVAPVLEKTVRVAVAEAARVLPDVPMIAGGKSMGGRMTSQARSKEPLPGVRGLVFLGFPLHAAGKPEDKRGDHLDAVKIPMLFIQGTRDSLADLTLMKKVCAKLGSRATLHIVEGGDHSFAVLKRDGRSPEEVRGEIADTIAGWSF